MNRPLNRHIPALAALAAAAALAAGCGSSSKPAYCSAVSNLKSSIRAIPNTNVLQNGVSALNSAVAKVQSDAKQVVNDAKNDFPQETNALTMSVDALSGTVKQLQNTSPTPALLTQFAAEAASVASAVKQFTDATSSKCG